MDDPSCPSKKVKVEYIVDFQSEILEAMHSIYTPIAVMVNFFM